MSGHVHPDELTEQERHNVNLCSQRFCRYCQEQEYNEDRDQAVQDLVKALEVTLRELGTRGIRPPWFTEYEQLAHKHKAVKNVRSPV